MPKDEKKKLKHFLIERNSTNLVASNKNWPNVVKSWQKLRRCVGN